MQVYEITGNTTGVSRAGINFLQPKDSYQNLVDGFLNREVLQSRYGFSQFGARLSGETRILGLFEYISPDGTTKLLAMDRNFCYLYNASTQVYDVIPFGGSLTGYAGFAITTDDDYFTGAAYPDKSNNGRFVFTSVGIPIPAAPTGIVSSIFFYDEVNGDIRSYTNSATDNPAYVPPTGLVLTTAKYIFFNNERLNFGAPAYSGIFQNQQVLFSAIRDSGGGGDDYAKAGSGTIAATTSEEMTGATINGQIVNLNFQRSAWTLEITQDPFNPYFIRKVPGVLGTTASYSAVAWNNVVKSVGVTGILGCDGRQNLRADNKIPYFARDEITANRFSYITGGFDRFTSQFLWTYISSNDVSETQDMVLVNNYEEDTWNTYKMRFTVLTQSDVGNDLTWDEIDESGNNPPEWATWDTTTDIWDRIGLRAGTQKTLAGDDLGFVYELDRDFQDYYTNITNITLGANTVFAVNASGIKAGDVIYVDGITSTVQLNGKYYTVVSATDVSITINQDSLTFTPYVATSGYIQKAIEFYAETIPFNPYRDQGMNCYVSYIEFLLESNGGSLLVDVLVNDEMFPVKQNVPVVPVREPRDWVKVIVNSQATFFTFVMKQTSVSAQARILSMRIHAEPEGMTNG